MYYYYRKFVEAAFKYVNKEIHWEGKGLDEVAREKDSGIIRLKVNAKFFRPTEVDQLLGDPTKAKTKLGWKPKVNMAPDMRMAFVNIERAPVPTCPLFVCLSKGSS